MALRWWLALATLLATSALGAVAPAAPGVRAPGVGVAGPFGALAAATVRPPHGAAVVAVDPAASSAAKALARRIYQDPTLRPDLDETTVATLVGAGPACPSPATASTPEGSAATGPDAQSAASGERCATELVELRDVMSAVQAACSGGCNGSPVARRLLSSLGRDLAVRWIVLVSLEGSVEGGVPAPSARLLRVSTGRFEPMVLGPSQKGQPGATDWGQVVAILRSVAAAAEPPSPAPARASGAERRKGGPGKKTGAASREASDAPKGAAAEATDDGEVKVLSSPWFWGGLGVLVAAGITVFALSQSSLGEPDTVRLEGRVAP